MVVLHHLAMVQEVFREIEATGEPLIVTDHASRSWRSGESSKSATVLRYDDPFEPAGNGGRDVLK